MGDGGIADETDDALAAFGLVRETAGERQPFKVYPFNWLTLTMFWATWNQWRKIVLGQQVIRDGIDWAQVESALNLSRTRRSEWPMIFEGLQAMEVEALNFLNRDK